MLYCQSPKRGRPTVTVRLWRGRTEPGPASRDAIQRDFDPPPGCCGFESRLPLQDRIDSTGAACDVKEKLSFSPDKRTWSPSPLLGQIVLVTSLNEDGQSNVAPKSWLSIGRRRICFRMPAGATSRLWRGTDPLGPSGGGLDGPRGSPS